MLGDPRAVTSFMGRVRADPSVQPVLRAGKVRQRSAEPWSHPKAKGLKYTQEKATFP